MKYLDKISLGFYFTLIFLTILFINLYYLEGIPHVPDDSAYLFMSKIFASGNIILPIPVSGKHVDFFPGILSVKNGTWLFQYPFGHPLLLSIGTLIRLPQIIPPLVGTLFIFLLFLIAKKVYSKKAAYFLLPLPFLSPFFLENSASFMSHNTAALYLTASLYTLIIALKTKKSFLFFLSGIFLGLLFNTRPLTFLPFIFLFPLVIFHFNKHMSSIKKFVFFIAGFSILFFLWLLYNKITTGNMLSSQYFFVNQDLFGIHENVSLDALLSQRIKNVLFLFNSLGPMLFNIPAIIVYALLIVPLVKQPLFWDKFFFLCLFTLPFVYFFYNGTFIMYGPRFWYEILPFIFLLIARSLTILYAYRKKTTIVLLVIFSTISLASFLSIFPTHDPDFFSPLQVKKLRGFNFVDGRILTQVKKHNLHNAVVFVKPCGENWWCYGSVFPQNNPTLTTDIVYLKDMGQKNKKVKAAYRNRSFYTIDYYSLKLQREY